MGKFPLTIFILLAATLVYLQTARRQNAQEGRQNAQQGVPWRPKVLIPGPMLKGRIYSQQEAVEWLRKRGVEANLFGSFTEEQLREWLRDTSGKR